MNLTWSKSLEPFEKIRAVMAASSPGGLQVVDLFELPEPALQLGGILNEALQLADAPSQTVVFIPQGGNVGDAVDGNRRWGG